ncbi:hypothetical protein ACVDG3_14985 [Meridianimarinicoccus sp. RP-17]|uniref:hypothetical protein n=1 Tax=Meridianimarinicoccus zhengii TaxID=2056810 RepID=UPI000DAB9637|nr:hypothetical protein [Phycocomes zhengii]
MTPTPAPTPSLPFHRHPAMITVEIVHCAENGTPRQTETRALWYYVQTIMGAGRDAAWLSAS